MDIYCKRCGEPWALPFDMKMTERDRMLRGEGCPCCYGKEVELDKRTKQMIEVQNMMEDLLGDDLDGLASEMEDIEAMGFFNKDWEDE